MTRLLFFLAIFLCACSNSAEENNAKKEHYQAEEVKLEKRVEGKKQEPNAPFDKLQFDKIIAFDFSGVGERPTIYSKRRGYAELISDKRELNLDQQKELLQLLTDTSTYGGSTTACFSPNWGLVFYDKGSIVFVVDVCLDCNYLDSSPEIAASAATKDKLSDGSEIVRFGFSQKGQQAIIDLCKKLDMKYGKYQINKKFQ